MNAPGGIRTPDRRIRNPLPESGKSLVCKPLAQSQESTGAIHGALCLQNQAPDDPDLAYLIDRWPSMSDYIKQQILALALEHTTTSHEQEGAEA